MGLKASHKHAKLICTDQATQGSVIKAKSPPSEDLKEAVQKALFKGRKTMKYYLNLGQAAHKRRTQTHRQQDPITLYKDILKLGWGRKEYRKSLLYRVGTALESQYAQSNKLDQLEEAILYFDQGLSMCQTSHTVGRYRFLKHLGLTLRLRYQKLKKIEDIEKAIICHKQALDLCPPGHISRPSILNNLGIDFSTRYSQLQGFEDLGSMIDCYEQSLSLCLPGCHLRFAVLINLAHALQVRFHNHLETRDLDKEIICYEEALKFITCDGDSLDFRPFGHKWKSTILVNLGNALQVKFYQLGDVKDLGKAIDCFGQALDLCPSGHSRRFSVLVYLRGALQVRFQHLNDIEDLERSITILEHALITIHEHALNIHSRGDHTESTILVWLGDALQDRYQQLEDINDLSKSIGSYELALYQCAYNHPMKPIILNSLGHLLQTRSRKLGVLRDLEKSIIYHKQASAWRFFGYPRGFTALHSFAFGKYERIGGMDISLELISCHEHGPLLCGFNCLNRVPLLNNLATALQTRYEYLSKREDLEKAIVCYKEVLDFCPPDHFYWPTTSNNLATALQTRYEKFGETDDLEQAISYHEEVLNLRPPGQPNRAFTLNNFANALRARYRLLWDVQDLDKAILYHQEALELCTLALGKPNRSTALNNLAVDFKSRYDQSKTVDDLENAIFYHKQALDLCLPGHPGRSVMLNSLANALQARYEELGEVVDLTRAVTLFEQASFNIQSSLPERLAGAKHWAKMAHKNGLSSAVSAYSLALNLLQQHLSLLPTLTSQQNIVELSSQLSLNAASCAIGIGTPEVAVEFLEQGRSILWSKIQGYRQHHEEISRKAPCIAAEFYSISKQLEHNLTSGNAESASQQALSQRWTELLEEIQQLDGFSTYLQSTPFQVLKKASSEGPVIMVNISQFQSDAIILVNCGSPVVVPLSNVSPQMLKQLVSQLSQVTTSSNPSNVTYCVLQYLWQTIVGPIVKQLRKLDIPEKSCIWWCPTSYLCALPLHAAGLYRKGFKNLPDLYVSSYTPTLISLIRARSNMPVHQPNLALLLVSEPDDTIPHVFEEVEVLKDLQVQINSCSGKYSDKKNVLASLQSHSWVHFACHAHLEAQPFDSWFQLYAGEHLTVLDLAKSSVPNAEFAFLSACHSASGNVHGTPDESIHLAGALQFSGFRSVIGTLWAMVDNDGPSIAHAFYKHMFRSLDSIDLKDVALSLNIATKELRRQNVPVDRWINFVHIGP